MLLFGVASQSIPADPANSKHSCWFPSQSKAMAFESLRKEVLENSLLPGPWAHLYGWGQRWFEAVDWVEGSSGGMVCLWYGGCGKGFHWYEGCAVGVGHIETSQWGCVLPTSQPKPWKQWGPKISLHQCLPVWWSYGLEEEDYFAG